MCTKATDRCGNTMSVRRQASIEEMKIDFLQVLLVLLKQQRSAPHLVEQRVHAKEPCIMAHHRTPAQMQYVPSASRKACKAVLGISDRANSALTVVRC